MGFQRARCIFFSMFPFIKGVLLALTMAFGIGPGLILYFKASVKNGFWAGYAVILGLYLSDFIFITISYFGVSQLILTVEHQHFAGVVGGFLLMIFGLVMVLKKPTDIKEPSGTYTPRTRNIVLGGFLSGFFINSMNVFVLLSWMTIIGVAGIHFGVHTRPFFHFFIGLFGAIIFLDLTKCLLFSRINKVFDTRVLGVINRCAGGALVAVALVLIGKSIL